MRKTKLFMMAALAAAMMCSGCGNSADEKAADADVTQETDSGKTGSSESAEDTAVARDVTEKEAGGDAESAEDTSAELPAPGEIMMSGSWGEGVTYTFDSKGILTISGTGDMAYSEGAEYPEADDIVYLVAEEGITEVVDFWMPAKLTYVSLPSTIESFKFECCEELTTVYLAEGITELESSALHGCDGLTELALPKSLTKIGSSAFSSSNNLKLTLPEGLMELGSGALAYTGITEITIPQGINRIRQEMFYGCDKLTSVTIPAGVKTIEDMAFADCTALTDIYYQGTEEEFKNIQVGAENEAFLNANIYYNEI